MEKIRFSPEGGQEVWFYVLEETTIAGKHYLLVTEEEEGDCDALILREQSDKEDTESVYEIVDQDDELSAVAAMFESLLEDIKIEQ